MCNRSHWLPPELAEFKSFEKCPAVPLSAHTPPALVSLCILGPLHLQLTFCSCFILTPSLSHGLHQTWSVIFTNMVACLKQLLGPSHFTTFFLLYLPVCFPHDLTESETACCLEFMHFAFSFILWFIFFILNFICFCLQYFLSSSLIMSNLSCTLNAIKSLLFFSVLTVSCLQLFN